MDDPELVHKPPKRQQQQQQNPLFSGDIISDDDEVPSQAEKERPFQTRVLRHPQPSSGNVSSVTVLASKLKPKVTKDIPLMSDFFKYYERISPEMVDWVIADIGQTDKNILSTLTAPIVRSGGLDEVHGTQPNVRKLCALIMQSMFKCFQPVIIPAGSYTLKGYMTPCSYQPPSDHISERRLCRVFYPHEGSPDLELAYYFPGNYGFNVYPSHRPSPDRYFVSAAPPAEVKNSLNTSPANLQKWQAQAAGYGVRFILRVFPMLPESLVHKIFPDRHVYVPLLSNHEIFILDIGVRTTIATGDFAVASTKKITGKEYFRVLMSWLAWASNVVTSLYHHQTAINQVKPINCWVPLEAYAGSFREVREHPEHMEPRPSFFNPIFFSSRIERYYRIQNSYWCGNGSTKVPSLSHRAPSLFADWYFEDNGISMPNLGYPLRFPHVDNTAKLVKILTQVLAQLRLVSSANFAHMDLRADNILIRPATGKVSLIDFDHIEYVTFDNAMAHQCPETPPEEIVHSNSDMWQLGVMLWTLLGTEHPRRLSRVEDKKPVFEDSLHGKFVLASDGDYAGHEVDIVKFVEDCVIVDPDRRLSIDEAMARIAQWQ